MSDLISETITKVLKSPEWAFAEEEIPQFLEDVKAALSKIDLVGEATKLAREARLERRSRQSIERTRRWRAQQREKFREAQVALLAAERKKAE